ncbi:prepilin peptidase [Chondromyces apiculatus]|uniref:Prepilin leader peptidase/N-methyltransferase n=1 Tax=Chondromyces apiculatus DSM 436 TaxID=1192034 RepID=A0A017T437_9BACT|nr:A24 family peptidase [Chondromyces apiculatus]EYF04008.1 Leader peptidase (Prepilin peptidase) [Chondromyces apiculatus DSM 436]
MTIADFPPWFLRAFALCFGLIWGSFLNVVIHRVPSGMSVVHPGSTCPACKKPIRAWDNIPVFSWLLLRGRARCCGARIKARYPLVEAVGGLLSLAIVEAIVFRLPPETSIARGLAIYVADLALALGLLAATFIDLEHMYIPDGITLGGAVLGVATASLRDLGFLDALLGAAVGFVIVWLPFVVIYPRLRGGRVGMGLGDAKLLVLAGAWFGWGGALFVLGAGAVQGTLAAIAVLLVRGRIEEPEAVREEREQIRAELAAMTDDERAEAEKELAEDPLAEEPGEGFGQARMAFGPFLALATLECLLVGRDIIGAYLAWIDTG